MRLISEVRAFGSVADPDTKRFRIAYSAGPAVEASAWEACRIVQATPVDRSDLLLVHSEAHIKSIEERCAQAVRANAAFYPIPSDVPLPRRMPKGDVDSGDIGADGDIYFSPDSLAAMKLAAGGAVQAVRALFKTDAKTGHAVARSDVGACFAIVRPPGHHCCDAPAGFCYFSNTAIAAAHARAVLGISRVAIVDWDYHHGDGTQGVYYRDPSVLTISLHACITADGLAYPCSADMGPERHGMGLGRGYNINIPWPNSRVGEEEYMEAFRTIVVPALKGFDPELILVASGFDACQGDMLAGLRLRSHSYHGLTEQLLELHRPLAIILEGGYSPEIIAEASLNVVHALLGRQKLPESAVCAAAAAEALKADATCPGDDIPVGDMLDAIRWQLNTLPPWCGLKGADGEPLFHELPGPDAQAANEKTWKKLILLIEKLTSEDEQKRSYYKQINGVKYSRVLLERAEADSQSGPLSLAEAKELLETAQNGPGITDTERRTLEYCLRAYEFSDQARNLLHGELETGRPSPLSKTIDNVKYDRHILEQAEQCAKLGPISLDEAVNLWEGVHEKGARPIDTRTFLYTMEHCNYTLKARRFLAGRLPGQYASMYKQVGGERYHRHLLEKAELFAASGPIELVCAKDLLEDAKDGKGVSEIQKKTLLHTLEAFAYTDEAAGFLKGALQ